MKCLKFFIGAPHLLVLSKNTQRKHYICPPETVSFVQLYMIEKDWARDHFFFKR